MKLIRVSQGYFLNLESELEKDFSEKEKADKNKIKIMFNK